MYIVLPIPLNSKENEAKKAAPVTRLIAFNNDEMIERKNRIKKEGRKITIETPENVLDEIKKKKKNSLFLDARTLKASGLRNHP